MRSALNIEVVDSVVDSERRILLRDREHRSQRRDLKSKTCSAAKATQVLCALLRFSALVSEQARMSLAVRSHNCSVQPSRVAVQRSTSACVAC